MKHLQVAHFTRAVAVLFFAMALTAPIKAQPLDNEGKAAVQQYVDKFGALDEQAITLSLALSKDVELAYYPRTPPEREYTRKTKFPDGASPQFRQARVQIRAQKRHDFLNSPEGVSWKKKRQAMRQALTKNLSYRIGVIRRATAKMRAISPVPPALRAAHVEIIAYSRVLDHLVGLMRKAVHRGIMNGLDYVRSSDVMDAHRVKAMAHINRLLDTNIYE